MVDLISLEPFKDLYPFKSHTLEIGALKYHYLDEGSGDILLMVHGNPTWSFYYRTLVLGLRRKYRCVVPDHMGCGLSDKPQEYNYTLQQHIDNLSHLVESLELNKITLLMHDWGGAIGMGLAVKHPDKIKRLVVFNTSAFLSERIPFSINICRWPVFGPIAIRCFNAFAKSGIRRACMNQGRMTDQVKAGYLAPYNSFANRVANLRFVQDIPMSPDVPSYPVVQYIESQLSKFQDRPMVIVWGKKDFCFDDHFLNRWKEIFPHARVHEIADAGHYVVEDAHERIIPWLDKFFVDHPIS
ncbi:MAG: alpha/beta fold hydrolase [Nitrospinales bacterium]